MAESKTVTDIMGKINSSDANSRSVRDRWLEYYKLYRNWRVTGYYGGRSNVGIPLAFEWVEVVKSRLFDVFFGKRPYVRVSGREPTDDLPARVIQQYQSYQYDLANYRKLGYDLLTQVLIYGTGIAKVFWKYEEEEQFVDRPIFPDFPEAGTVPVKEVVPTYDNIGLELVDVFDFFIDPEATTIEDARWVAHRTRRTYDYLKKMEERGVYKNVGAVLVDKEEVEGTGAEMSQHKQERDEIEGHLPGKAGLMKQFDVYEYWEDDKLVTIVDGKYEIRNSDNPNRHKKKPFIEAKVISTPHEFYGIGLIESGSAFAKVMEDLLNSGLDSVNFSINPMTGVDQTRVDDTELVSRPGGHVHTIGNPRDALYPFVTPDATGGVFNFFNLVNELTKRGTGIVDYMVGQTMSNKTATEASLMTNEAAKRIGLHIKVFGMTLVGPLAKMVYQLNKQFTTSVQTLRVTNMPEAPFGTIDITPDLFGAEVDFVWESEDRELNNMVAVQQLTSVLAIAQTHPVLAMFIPIIFEKLLEKYDMHENEELKQAAQMAKQMAPIYQQLSLQQMQSQIQAAQAKQGGGIGNAPRPTGGKANNVSQSINAQANPSLGNSPV